MPKLLMTGFLRKTGRTLFRFMLALCAVLLAVLVLLQCALTIGINLLNTGRGTAFLEKHINQALAQSGYTLNIHSIYYDPLRGFTLYGLSLADTQGPFLAIDRVSADISFTTGLLRTLDLSISGGTLALERLPASPAKTAPDGTPGLTPFTVPDIYFNALRLSKFTFDHVTLGKTIAGKSYDFSPSLQARLTLGDTLSLDLRLKPGMPDFAPGLPAPRTLRAAATLAPETLDLSVERIILSTPDYKIAAHGTANLGKDGALDITADIAHNNLSPLTQDMLQDADARITIGGTMAEPVLGAGATITPASLKERGLGDIAATITAHPLREPFGADIAIKTTFNKDPVTLATALAYENAHIKLTGIRGDAPALTLTGDASYATETGMIDGTLKLAAADLARYTPLLKLPVSGALNIDATLEPGGNAQSLALDVKLANAAYDGIKIRTLTAQASLPDIRNPWPQSARIQATALDLPDGTLIDTLTATIADASNDQYKLTLKGRGSAPVAVAFDGTAMLSNLTAAIPTARDMALTLTLGKSTAKISGMVAPDAVDLKLNAPGLRARDLPVSLPTHLGDMRIDTSATMTGTLASPHTTLNATLTGIGAGAYRNAAVKLAADHAGDKLTATLTGSGTGIRRLDANAALPMRLALMPFDFALSDTAPLVGAFNADADLAAIAPLFLTPTQKITGALAAQGTLGGTPANPALDGTLRLSGASFTDDANGIMLAAINASGRFTNGGITITALSATDGGNGRIDAHGTFAFAGSATDMDLRMHDFNIPRSDLANGIVSAALALKGSNGDMRLTGTANVAQMNIVIPETFESRIPQLNIVQDAKRASPGMLDRLALDIRIEAHNQVFVRGWGLDTEFGGDIAITGTAAAPEFNGTLESRRGRYEEFGKRFTLERANLRFQGAIPPSPYLDIEATTPAGDVTGAIQLTGPVQAPKIAFTSTPALPQDEVLSRILFGRESARISPLQAVQLARTIQRFSGKGGGGIDPLDMLRSATGLDDISVDTDDTGAASVDVGKYLTDNVYLELSKGKTENSGAATIQIELTPSLNIESRIGQDAQGGGGIFWKRDY